MRILGIDPGSRLCGYAILDVEIGRRATPVYRECGVITTEGRLRFEQRLAEVSRQLTNLIAEFDPTVIAIEDVFSRINPRAALALAQARGAVVAVAGLAGLQVHSYPAPQVKRAITGRGRATKDQVARMVAALVGLGSPPESDAADALAVALTHVHMHNNHEEAA